MSKISGSKTYASLMISYSRKDEEFVKKLYDGLIALGMTESEIWVDWEGIPPTVDWMAEINKGIQQSDVFLFVITPNSINSKICNDEIEIAVKNKKRIVPILNGDLSKDIEIPAAISTHNWIFMTDDAQLEENLPILYKALNTDFDYLAKHTRLLSRSIEWEREDHKKAYLLRGEDLINGEEFLTEAAKDKDPSPTSLQAEYIQESRTDARRRARNTLFGVASALVVAIMLGIFANTQRIEAQNQKATAIANDNARATQASIAIENEAIALTQESIAQEALATQVAQSQTILRQIREVNARLLGQQAQNLTASDAQLALLLGLYGVQETSEDGFIHNEVSRALNAFLDSHLLLNFESKGAILKADFTPDGSLFVTGDSTGVLTVWNGNTGENILELNLSVGRLPGFHDVAISPDGSMVAAIRFWPKETVVYAVESGELLATLIIADDVAPGIGESVAFSPDGREMAIGYRSAGQVLFYSTEDFNFTGSFRGASRVNVLEYDPTGNFIAVGSSKGIVEIWNTATRTLELSFKAHDVGEGTFRSFYDINGYGGVKGLAFNADGTLLATSGTDKIIKTWDATTGAEQEAFYGHTGDVYDVSFHPTAPLLASVGENGEFFIWNTSTVEIAAQYNGHANWISSVSFDNTGSRIFTASSDGTAKSWTLDSPTAMSSIDMPRSFASSPSDLYPVGFDVSQINAFAYSASTETVMLSRIVDPLARRDGYAIEIYDLEGALIDSITSNFPTNSIIPFQDGYIYSHAGSEFAEIKYYDLVSKTSRVIGTAPESLVTIRQYHAALSSDQTQVVGYSYSKDHLIDIWDLQSEEKVYAERHTIFDDQARLISFSAEKQQLVFAYAGELRIFDLLTGEFIDSFNAHTGNITTVEFSKDGMQFLTASEDGTAILWDAAKMEQILVIEGHTGPVNGAVFANNESTIITASEDGTVEFWDISTGENLRTIQDHTDGVGYIAISPDGTRLVTASNDMRIFVYDLSQDALIEAASGLIRDDFTPEECQKYLKKSNCSLDSLNATSSQNSPFKYSSIVVGVFGLVLMPLIRARKTAVKKP